MRKKPRLLFIAYYFPPANAIGAVRAYNIARWLTRRGWEVTVVTPQLEVWSRIERAEQVDEELLSGGIRCIRTAHAFPHLSSSSLVSRRRGFRRVAGGLARRLVRRLAIPEEVGWLWEAERACAALAPQDVDLILATGSPFGSFSLARRLAERLHCPFVLDYRDLWTGNPHASRPFRASPSREESEILKEAAAVTAVSPSLVKSLQNQFCIDSKTYLISNGFDPESLRTVKAFDFGHFAIVYAGVFYPPKRVIDPIMEAIRRLKHSGAPSDVNWMFHYYGAQGAHVQEAARTCDVEDKVVLHGLVSREEALSAIKGAGIAIVITSVLEDGSLEDRAIVTGKLFDAMGLERPVVAIVPPRSDLERILATTGLGRCFSGTEIDQVASFLADAMRGRTPGPKRPEEYSWSLLGQRLDKVLRSVLREGASA